MFVASIAGLLVAASAPFAPPQDGPSARDLLHGEAPYFLLDDGEDALDRFPLESTDVSIEVAGVLAEAVLRQRYRNDGERPLSARYVFPASTRAAVHGLELVVGGRTLRARIAEREEARDDSERARSEGRGASLLEQERPKVFRMEVANVLPGETVEVALRYGELLVPVDGVYEFVLPTVVGPRSTGGAPASPTGLVSDSWTANPFLHAGEPSPAAFALRATIAAPLPLAALGCPSHRTTVSWTGPSSARLELDPSETAGADRDVVMRWRMSGERIATGLNGAPGAPRAERAQRSSRVAGGAALARASGGGARLPCWSRRSRTRPASTSRCACAASTCARPAGASRRRTNSRASSSTERRSPRSSR